MNLGFDEVIEIFECYHIWCNSRETLWYRKAWKALEKGGLTSYKNQLEKSIIYIRAFTLIMIYQEFCELEFQEECEYEFDCWQEFTDDLSTFKIGLLAGKRFKELDFSDYGDNDDAVEAAFMKLIKDERYKVVDCLVKNIGDGGENEIFVSMYLTCIDMTEHEDSEKYNDSNIDTEDINDYKKYEQDIEKYYFKIIDTEDDSDMEALDWLFQGTYSLR